MDNINSVTVIGSVVADSELRVVSGTDRIMLNFSIAVKRSKRNSAGVFEDDAHFFDVVMWGKSAESYHRLLVKGKKIGINGHIEQHRFEKAGQKRSKTMIVADKIELLTPKSANSATESAPINDDDIPF